MIKQTMRRLAPQYMIVVLVVLVGVLLLFAFVTPLQSVKVATSTSTGSCPKDQICGPLCTGNETISLSNEPQTKFHLLLGQYNAYIRATHDPAVAQYYQCENAYITIKLFL